jgi:hypothetical protein
MLRATKVEMMVTSNKCIARSAANAPSRVIASAGLAAHASGVVKLRKLSVLKRPAGK